MEKGKLDYRRHLLSDVNFTIRYFLRNLCTSLRDFNVRIHIGARSVTQTILL